MGVPLQTSDERPFPPPPPEPPAPPVPPEPPGPLLEETGPVPVVSSPHAAKTTAAQAKLKTEKIEGRAE